MGKTINLMVYSALVIGLPRHIGTGRLSGKKYQFWFKRCQTTVPQKREMVTGNTPYLN